MSKVRQKSETTRQRDSENSMKNSGMRRGKQSISDEGRSNVKEKTNKADEGKKAGNSVISKDKQSDSPDKMAGIKTSTNQADDGKIVENSNDENKDTEFKIGEVFSLPAESYLQQPNAKETPKSVEELLDGKGKTAYLSQVKCKPCSVVISNIDCYLKGKSKVSTKIFNQKSTICSHKCRKRNCLFLLTEPSEKRKKVELAYTSFEDRSGIGDKIPTSFPSDPSLSISTYTIGADINTNNNGYTFHNIFKDGAGKTNKPELSTTGYTEQNNTWASQTLTNLKEVFQGNKIIDASKSDIKTKTSWSDDVNKNNQNNNKNKGLAQASSSVLQRLNSHLGNIPSVVEDKLIPTVVTRTLPSSKGNKSSSLDQVPLPDINTKQGEKQLQHSLNKKTANLGYTDGNEITVKDEFENQFLMIHVEKNKVLVPLKINEKTPKFYVVNDNSGTIVEKVARKVTVSFDPSNIPANPKSKPINIVPYTSHKSIGMPSYSVLKQNTVVSTCSQQQISRNIQQSVQQSHLSVQQQQKQQVAQLQVQQKQSAPQAEQQKQQTFIPTAQSKQINIQQSIQQSQLSVSQQQTLQLQQKQSTPQSEHQKHQAFIPTAQSKQQGQLSVPQQQIAQLQVQQNQTAPPSKQQKQQAFIPTAQSKHTQIQQSVQQSQLSVPQQQTTQLQAQQKNSTPQSDQQKQQAFIPTAQTLQIQQNVLPTVVKGQMQTQQNFIPLILGNQSIFMPQTLGNQLQVPGTVPVQASVTVPTTSVSIPAQSALSAPIKTVTGNVSSQNQQTFVLQQPYNPVFYIPGTNVVYVPPGSGQVVCDTNGNKFLVPPSAATNVITQQLITPSNQNQLVTSAIEKQKVSSANQDQQPVSYQIQVQNQTDNTATYQTVVDHSLTTKKLQNILQILKNTMSQPKTNSNQLDFSHLVSKTTLPTSQVTVTTMASTQTQSKGAVSLLTPVLPGLKSVTCELSNAKTSSKGVFSGQNFALKPEPGVDSYSICSDGIDFVDQGNRTEHGSQIASQYVSLLHHGQRNNQEYISPTQFAPLMNGSNKAAESSSGDNPPKMNKRKSRPPVRKDFDEPETGVDDGIDDSLDQDYSIFIVPENPNESPIPFEFNISTTTEEKRVTIPESMKSSLKSSFSGIL